MRAKAEKWIEMLVATKMMNNKVCIVSECADEYMAAHGITEISERTRQSIYRLIRRTKERVKKRIQKRKKNILMMRSQAWVPDEFLELLEKLDLIDLNDTVRCKKLIKCFVYRDFCLSQKLRGCDIPKDPHLPLHEWLD